MTGTSLSIVLFITALFSAFSLIRPISATSAEQNVLYTTIVSKNLLEDMLPTVKASVNINNTLLRTLIGNIVRLHDVKKKINNLSSSRDYLDGLQLIINQTEQAACNWMNQTVNGGFSDCNPSGFDSLRTKLNLYNQLQETENLVKDSSCQESH